MLDITILTIGKIKDKSYAHLAAEYLKRLRPYARIKMVELEAVAFSEKMRDKAKDYEGEKIENYLSKQTEAIMYLLAERGLEMPSPEFAYWLEKKTPLILVVGGALGFSEALYQKYPSLSLSALTFPHELARVVLLEQIYRAATILGQKNYHY
ncbi:MAG: 23S rRNA (pseudouridine(1915)-N(3))-methyltransferase RlmH [Patescibacteria group bacterium]